MFAQEARFQVGHFQACPTKFGVGHQERSLACHQTNNTLAKAGQVDASRQASGVSLSSDASCGMEYSCSLPATPAAREEQQAKQLQMAPSDELPPAAFEGWFAKCRGCGCMTAHEKLIQQADVPFCRRCQHTLETACPAMQDKMVATLLYVHTAWSNAGL